jgi:hypothetical protein
MMTMTRRKTMSSSTVGAAAAALALGASWLLATPGPLAGQYGDPAGDGARGSEVRNGAPFPVLPAIRIQGRAPVIDGRLDDEAWRRAPVANGFVQVDPREGAPASDATEVRVLYDDEALYVAFRAFDSAPDSIVGLLTRRDMNSPSDWVHVVVDSYHDRRTAFRFSVNPAGVKVDAYLFEDHREDTGWNAIWDVATAIDAEGWTAEFRIPLSQLRFSGAPLQDWGINFARDVARRNERSAWSLILPRENAVVSRLGVLEGLESLPRVRRVEVLPYSVTRLRRAPGEAANPFWSRNEFGAEVGADLKVGVTSNLTLDVTVNPDFGQVEADPAQLNLSAFETFVPERRPFFSEGAGIFQMGIGLGDGDGANQSLFYSRRIGRTPQGGSPQGDGWVDRPSQTRILSAAKLSGKTESGWSVGVLGAVTGAEEAHFRSVEGEEIRRTVEPLTSYSVGRIQRDLRGGETTVGGILTSVIRDGEVAADLGLRDRAFSGGVDLRHRFRGGTMELRSYLLGSHVSGSKAAILQTQRSSARYFQRPDADHLTLDPDATSLSGWTAAAEVWKSGGGPWRWAILTQYRSPGFEVNDLGFMPGTDFLSQVGYVGYRSVAPNRHFRNWGVNMNAWSDWTSGWERTNTGGNVNGHATFLNNWSANAGVNMNTGGLNPSLLRGGPALRTEWSWNGWAGVNSDSRRTVQVSANHNWAARPESDSWNQGVSVNTLWRPSGRASLRAGPFVSWREEDRQWVGRVGSASGDHYLFGRMEQTTVGLTARVDLAVTPALTLQLYGQPFVSSQAFHSFKQVSDPRARRYEDRLAEVDAVRDGGVYRADLNGDGALEAFGVPDFRFGQFRSNAVLRWEYRPGSTLFLVWAQSRDDISGDGAFRFGDGMRGLFEREPENVFLVKLSYWFNP